MPQTSRYGLTSPPGTGPADGPAVIQALAQDVEDALGAVDDKLNGYAPGGDVWQSVPLQTGWSKVTDYEPLVTVVGRLLTIRGIVRLASTGLWTNPIVLLPSGLRPAEQQAIFTYASDSARSKLAIFFTSDGLVRISAGYSQTIATGTLVPLYGQIALG